LKQEIICKPADLGFRMPGEWEPHRGTWLSWPRREGISFPGRYDSIPPVFAAVVGHLVDGESVFINVWNEDEQRTARDCLRGINLEPVQFHQFPSYEPWCRDHGPIFIVRDDQGCRECAVVDWDYNAWGNKYVPNDLDDKIPRHIAELRGMNRFEPGLVLEGGSIEVNGKGTLLTTESCLLNENRNPNHSREEIECALHDFLGITQVLWLHQGIAGDDTDGHIDDLARFVDPQTIVAVREQDPADENYAVLQDNWERLQSFQDGEGRPFRLVDLPMPKPIWFEGQRLPASYANFYIANRVVLLPFFGQPSDAVARDRLQSLFPDRRVIGVDSTALIWGLGSFHCLTQQEPAG